MALSLDEFTRTVDPGSLPRILFINSGIYVQGSVYEMFGRECSLPTGEVMKITAINLSSVTAEMGQDGADVLRVTLPLDYPGLFRIVPDPKPYRSIGDIVESVRTGPGQLGRHTFCCLRDEQGGGPLQEGETFTLTAARGEHGEGSADCEVTRRDGRLRCALRLSHRCQFCESHDEQLYTLKELLEWKMPRRRKRRVTLAKVVHKTDGVDCDLLESCCGEITLCPVYELQAVMKFRKDVVRIPSNLDVEVTDVTDEVDHDSFVQPLSLQDLFRKPADEFPMVVEVLEPPAHVQEELRFLQECPQLLVHRACQAKRILASEIRSDAQRRFLIPFSYKGRLKRRPREFLTAYDLAVAKSEREQLHVVATRPFQLGHAGLTDVSAGDQFLVGRREASAVVYGGTCETVEALACEKMQGKRCEPALVPMHLDGGFVEVIHDKKQYAVADVRRQFGLPFNVKVSVRDLSVPADVLAAVPGLHLEEEITEPYLLVSDPSLSRCWEVPVNRANMSVRLLRQDPGLAPPPEARCAVEEISEDCYYSVRTYAMANVLPPPRPPKKPSIPPKDTPKPAGVQSRRAESPVPHKITHNPSVNPAVSVTSQIPSAPHSPLSSSPTPVLRKAIERINSSDEVSDTDDKHDYEYIDEDELDNIRAKFQAQNILNDTEAMFVNPYEGST